MSAGLEARAGISKTGVPARVSGKEAGGGKRLQQICQGWLMHQDEF